MDDLNAKLQATLQEMHETSTQLSTGSINSFLALIQSLKAEQRTEGVNPKYVGMQDWSDRAFITTLLHENQLPAIAAINDASDQLADAVSGAVEKLKNGGRLVYVGCGTSGRLGGLDAAELMPTYAWPEDRVVIAMSEPLRYITGTSKDGAEDNLELVKLRMDGYPDDARTQNLADIPEQKGTAYPPINENDVVICVAASGSTPYTCEFAKKAKERGAVVIGATSNPDAKLLAHTDFPIVTQTGWEIPDGSTRMAAGTAQKSVLSALTTGIMRAMPGIYGIHDGSMVNMYRAPNKKLNGREIRIVSELAHCDKETAEAALKAVYNDLPETVTSVIKESIIVARSEGKTNPQEAHALVEKHERHLGHALEEHDRTLSANGPERFKSSPIERAAERNAKGTGWER